MWLAPPKSASSKCHGPMSYAEPSPIKESLFVLDPDGNTLELSVRRDPVSDKPQGKIVPLRRISHVRVEVTDMAQGKSWYRDTFGLTEGKQVPGDEQVTLTVPNTGQLVILHRVDQVAERSTRAVKGPHIDFRIAPELYPPILEKFNRKEYYWGPDPTKIPGTSRADIRCTVTIRSAIGFRSATASNEHQVIDLTV